MKPGRRRKRLRKARGLTASALAVLGPGLSRIARGSGRRAGIALVYHAIAEPEGDPERQLVPPVAPWRFRRQIAFLARHYRVVPADELPAAVARRRRWERFPLAITLDDDLVTHVEAGRILRRLGVPATFFLSGASLEEPRRSWWQGLQEAYDQGLASEGALSFVEPGRSIAEAAEQIKLAPPGERQRIARELERMLGPPAMDNQLTAVELRELAEHHGIGFHTLRHDFLPALSDPELSDAMESGRPRLESTIGRRLQSIGYPHGGADERVAAAARAAGFALGFTTQPVAVSADSDPMLLGRLEPSTTSAGRLALSLVRALWRPG